MVGAADFETKASYSINVVAMDRAGLTVEKAVTLAVNNVNEAPIITSGGAGALVENAAAGAVVYRVANSDSDANDSVSYSLSGADAVAFSIDSLGVVRLNAAADYAVKTSYSINVVTTDRAALSSTKPVIVAVIPVGYVNSTPAITSGDAGAVAENAPLSTVLYSVAISDADANDSVSYSLSGPDAGAFTIDSAGAVRLVGAADFETKASYSINVVAMDRAGLTVEKAVTLAVNNVNEAPIITSGGAGALVENAAAGAVVYRVANSDSDANDSVSYSLSGADAGAFTIDSAGAVRLVGAADFETKASYSINVVAMDRAGLTVEKAVTLAVNNVNEAPIITSGGAGALVENAAAGAVVYRVANSDSDANDSVSYSLSGADAVAFSIDSDGAVRMVAAADFEARVSYSINVLAMDRAGLIATKAVTVAVTNLDEVAPNITSGTSARAINENSAADQVVYTATSADGDDTASGFTVYSLKAGSDAGLSINASTGAVTLAASPNYETKPSYSFTVVATDAANNAAEKVVTLAITNLDEVAPIINSGGSAQAINENSGAGQVVYTASSTDTGDTASGFTVYSLKAGSDAGLSINASTGAVTLAVNPNYETKPSYSFTVMATDAARNTAEKALTLSINNLNEAPVITSGGAGTVAENATVSTVVYTVTASDQDTGNNLIYSLSGADAGFFDIVSSTGLVRLKASADFETRTSYSITVVATDNGVGSLSGSKAVTVSVIDIPEPVTTITTTTRSDGTRVTTTVTTNPDGSSFTELVEVDRNGMTFTKTIELAANGTQSIVIKQTIDGASVTENTITKVDGSGVNLLTVDPIPSNRQDTVGTANADRADIALYYLSTVGDVAATTVSLPTGVGLVATGVRTPITLKDAVASWNTLLFQTATISEAEKAIMLAGGQTFLSDLASVGTQAPLIVNSIKLSQVKDTGADPSHPITISGTASRASLPSDNPIEVLVIDTRELPLGRVLELQNVEFAVLIGNNITLRGGAGANIVFASDGSQNMVLGAEDDILHGGGGSDVLGSQDGNDQLFGDDGNDTLVGGLGNDHMEGGAGNDLLVGGQSDAGQLSLSQLKDQLSMRWTPGDTTLADSVGWSTTGSYDGGIPIDPRLSFLYQSGVMRETVTELYELLLYRLPTVEEMSFWCSAGYSVAELEEGAARMLSKYVLGLPIQYQVQFVMGQVWGADKVTDAQVQSNTNLLNTGGTWAQLIDTLIKHDNFKAVLLDVNGSMTLTQSSSLPEIGWSPDIGADTLLGGAGNDTLVGGRGNDVLDGGDGLDTALWFGTVANFEVKMVGNGTSKDVALLDTSSGEVDIIRNIEQLQIGGVNFDASRLGSLLSVEAYLASHTDHHLQVVLLGLSV